MWKYEKNSAIQILREISFGIFEAQKTAILLRFSSSKFPLGEILTFKYAKICKVKIQASNLPKW